MAGTSWSHRLARILVRPLVSTGITPNHLTTLRLATGLLACAALLPADGAWVWKDAYDAMEAAQVMFLRKFGAAMRTRANSGGSREKSVTSTPAM